MINNHELYGDKLQGMKERINNAIHETGIAKAKDLTSKEIIDFIVDIDQNNYTKKDLNIVKSINIYEMSEEDFIKFNGIWIKTNNDNNELLINLIFEKITTIKDFSLIFKLIQPISYNANSAHILVTLFKNLFYSYNEKICPNILQDIKSVLKTLVAVPYLPNDFFDFIEYKLPNYKINNLYLDIIKNEINLSRNMTIKKRIIRFFTQQSYINNIESIVYVLGDINNSNNNTFINDFLSGLDNFIIVEEDFYKKEFNSKFLLYKHVRQIFKVKKGLNINNNYFNKSDHNLKTLCNKISNFEFNFSEITLINQQIDDNAFSDNDLETTHIEQ